VSLSRRDTDTLPQRRDDPREVTLAWFWAGVSE
jgi:hypothetical protein